MDDIFRWRTAPQSRHRSGERQPGYFISTTVDHGVARDFAHISRSVLDIANDKNMTEPKPADLDLVVEKAMAQLSTLRSLDSSSPDGSIKRSIFERTRSAFCRTSNGVMDICRAPAGVEGLPVGDKLGEHEFALAPGYTLKPTHTIEQAMLGDTLYEQVRIYDIVPDQERHFTDTR